MKHSNIAIFIPHAGCRHRCSFCNQKTITAQESPPRAADVQRICTQALQEIRDRSNTEIAFFGGSFTAVGRSYMMELLEAAQPFLGTDSFAGIRISTRPDCIDPEVLAVLKEYGVTAIELGAQSMCDHVLLANERGHTVQDVENACRLIRREGFGLGLQMMVGLYRSTPEDERLTIRRITALRPDSVRIYPVAVLEGTALAARYAAGEYELFPFETAIELCCDALEAFETAGIAVIRCGLHASEAVQQNCVAGFYHPAFRELCEGRLMRRRMAQALCGRTGDCRILVHPSCISRAVGHGRENLSYFAQHGICVKVTGDEHIPKLQCKVKEP